MPLGAVRGPLPARIWPPDERDVARPVYDPVRGVNCTVPPYSAARLQDFPLSHAIPQHERPDGTVPAAAPLLPFVTPGSTRTGRTGMGRRTQMKPVAARATFWLTESFSAGRARSFRPAATRPHLAIGAQKKMVLIRVSGWPISVTGHHVAVTGLCLSRQTDRGRGTRVTDSGAHCFRL